MKKIIFGIVIIGIIIWIVSVSDKEVIDTEPRDGETPMVFSIRGELLDVTEGEVVRGVQTTETTSGVAEAGYTSDEYLMSATFTDLPTPQGDDFYEGWVVRKGLRFSVISTGPLTNEGDGTYTNVFTSDENLLDHSFYVLTLEPNDGDPAPADHILEGDME